MMALTGIDLHLFKMRFKKKKSDFPIVVKHTTPMLELSKKITLYPKRYKNSTQSDSNTIFTYFSRTMFFRKRVFAEPYNFNDF